MNKYVRQWLIGTLLILAFAISVLARTPSTLATPFDGALPTQTYVPPTPTPIWPGLYTRYYVPSVMHGWTANHINLPPYVPHSPNAEHNTQSNALPNVSLAWEGGDQDSYLVYYDVYLEAHDPTPDVLVSENTTYARYGFSAWGSTTYYWQVIARDAQGLTASGPVWQFTTDPCSVSMWVAVPEVDGLSVSIKGDASSFCSNIMGISWDWGDGTSDDQDFPGTHTYAEPGGYTVTVQAYNDQGFVETMTLDIYVGPMSGICDYVTEIPKAECDALAALYEATDGENWDVDPGWMVMTTPCDHYIYGWDGVGCEDGHVTLLHLGGSNLVGDVPPEIEDLSYLIRLYLSSNPITSVPAEIGNLTALTQLGLGSSQISQLPVEIGNLVNLTIFSIWGAQLTSLPPEIGNLEALVDLYLDENHLTSLPVEIGHLMNLNHLTLNNNNLTSLPDAIGNLYSLERLYLHNNALTMLPSTVGNLKALRILEVPDNALTSVPISIGDLENISQLHLHNNPALTGPVPDFLIKLTTLQTFRFDGTNWCEPVIGPVADWLAGIYYEGTGIPCP